MIAALRRDGIGRQIEIKAGGCFVGRDIASPTFGMT
jgi:hypothetical protein